MLTDLAAAGPAFRDTVADCWETDTQLAASLAAGYSRMLDELTSTRVDQPDRPADSAEPDSAEPSSGPLRPDGDDDRADGAAGSATRFEELRRGVATVP